MKEGMRLLLGVGPCKIGLLVLLVFFNGTGAIVSIASLQVFELKSANEVHEGRLGG